jgi:nucleotide-binding universal stress UspA family protein
MTDRQAFLAIVDGSAESARAIRFAALRARRTAGRLILAHVVAAPQFVQWGGVQADLEAEAEAAGRKALDEAAALVRAVDADEPETLLLKAGPGDGGEAVFDLLAADRSIRALVLAAAPRGKPGPLVSYFGGERAGSLPCMLIIVPGGLSEEEVDRLT